MSSTASSATVTAQENSQGILLQFHGISVKTLDFGEELVNGIVIYGFIMWARDFQVTMTERTRKHFKHKG